MPVPDTHLRPAFNIIRCSHAVLESSTSTEAARSTRPPVGLHVEDSDDKAVYLRGSEEHQHHSLVLRKAPSRPAAGSASRSAMTAISTRPRRSFPRTASPTPSPSSRSRAAPCSSDPAGFQLELYATMEKRPHLLRRYDLYKGCHPQRLDHFNVFAPGFKTPSISTPGSASG